MPRFSIRLLLPLLAAALGYAGYASSAVTDSRLEGAFRNPAKGSWIFVHLQGAPATIGFQHGYLLAPEIEDAKKAIELSTTHDVKHSWTDLRGVAEKTFWPNVPEE